MGAAALAACLALVASACGSDDDGGSADTTAAEAETTAAGGETTAAGGDTTAATGGDTTAAAATGECQPGTGTVEPIATAEADGAGKTVGLLFDVTGRGDKSFNDGAAAGLDKAAEDFGITTEESEPTAQDGSDRPERIAGFVGDDLIVSVGFLWGDATTVSAAENPDQLYAIIDSVVNVPDSDPPTLAPNVRSMVFAEQEGSFLVGAAAACASATGKLGFIGGQEIDLIKKFEAGFTAGAQAVNPDATVEVQYISQPGDNTGFNDPAKGKAIGTAMYDSGIDVIYAAAGGSGAGMFEAALESGKEPGEIYAIGVDSDQYEQVAPELQPYILTSALKRVDVATYEAITDMLNGELTGEVKVYNAANNGVGYAVSNEAINQYAGTLEELKAQIIDGTIVVPEVPGG
jgi:basic membrane protein A